jgi:pyruvate kinase
LEDAQIPISDAIVMQGERKNCSLPGIRVDLPVLLEKDIEDIEQFACKHNFDFVAASFVQSATDVETIRTVLDQAGGEGIQIISKIENSAGLENFTGASFAAACVAIARKPARSAADGLLHVFFNLIVNRASHI